MARGLLHGIVAVAASAHSPVPPPLTVVPPPPLTPANDDGGFSPLPAPRPPSTELGRALPGSQHDGRQLAHSTTIVGSGSIVGSVTSASLLDYVRATLHFARFRLEHRAAARRASKHALPPAWPLMPSRARSHARSHTLCSQTYGVAVSGSYAYVTAAESDALVVVDISNPASPAIRGSVVSSSLLNGVRVRPGVSRAQMASGAALARPSIMLASAAPPPADALSHSHSLAALMCTQADGVAVSGLYAYVTGFYSDSLVVVDVSNPASPVIRGSVVSSSLLDGVRVRPGALCARMVSGAALASAPSIVLASAAPPPADALSRSRSLAPLMCTQPMAVAVSGSYAYVTAAISDRLVVVDISNPASPVIRGSVVSSALMDGVRVTQSRVRPVHHARVRGATAC